jgi:hypothetical protein
VRRFLRGYIFSAPDVTTGDDSPHLNEKSAWVYPGINDAMVMAEHLFPTVAADFTKFIIGLNDAPGRVGDGNEGVLVNGLDIAD